jgi:hypothetical protein
MVSLYLLFKIVGEGEGNPHFIDWFGGGTGSVKNFNTLARAVGPRSPT